MAFIPEHCDIAVVGGGPSGALAALHFAAAGRNVVLIEARARATPPRDARALALSWGSRDALAAVGAWSDDLPSTPIDRVHVSRQGGWGRTVIDRADVQLPHLGLVVDYPQLVLGLERRLSEAGVTVLWQTRATGVRPLSGYSVLTLEDGGGERVLTCRLAVLAEGGALAAALPGMRRLQHDYHQSAVLAHLLAETPPAGVAYERFAARGPLALLPHDDGFMLVWTRAPDDAERLLTADDGEVIAELQQAIGSRIGRIVGISPRTAFPLKLSEASRIVAARTALIGNAAQTMHPVAAQGLNLGIRDAVALAAALADSTDPGDAAALAAYARARKRDSLAVVGFTHGLVALFDGPRHPLVDRAYGLGMAALDVVGPWRRRFARHLVFGVASGVRR
ncbi:FAD-dependent oxidoreductase [Paludibacterium yongneupense]|uniref:FAD-dependent oxidoreductase n=1 Tax=Paludibacterium yongneupense TaxID=400061 RepID=UPI00041F063A|nr:FAD-dependent oxidoreductase [Paludibacterium yongneupense]